MNHMIWYGAYYAHISYHIYGFWNTLKGKLEGDKQEIDDTHIIDTHDDIDYKAFIFDNDSCPKGCQCMANLADCGETSKFILLRNSTIT